MSLVHRLSVNGLVMPIDFPTAPFVKIHARLVAKVDAQGILYREHAGAWSAVSYRFLAATHYSDDFTDSITRSAGSSSVDERYRQERDLFGFFTNGLSSLEGAFYGLFAIGALLSPAAFPMMTANEQQAVTPARTRTGYEKAFFGDPIINVFDALLVDKSYLQLKDIRNVLAHRSAPGRQIYVSVGDSEPLPEEWKLLNISLDEKLTVSRRGELARLLNTILQAAQIFVEARF